MSITLSEWLTLKGLRIVCESFLSLESTLWLSCQEIHCRLWFRLEIVRLSEQNYKQRVKHRSKHSFHFCQFNSLWWMFLKCLFALFRLHIPHFHSLVMWATDHIMTITGKHCWKDKTAKEKYERPKHTEQWLSDLLWVSSECFETLSTHNRPYFDCLVIWSTEHCLSIKWEWHTTDNPTNTNTKRQMSLICVILIQSVVLWMSLKSDFALSRLTVPQFHCAVVWATQYFRSVGWKSHWSDRTEIQKRERESVRIKIRITLTLCVPSEWADTLPIDCPTLELICLYSHWPVWVHWVRNQQTTQNYTNGNETHWHSLQYHSLLQCVTSASESAPSTVQFPHSDCLVIWSSDHSQSIKWHSDANDRTEQIRSQWEPI